MDHRDHVGLLREGVQRDGVVAPRATWADIGAGTGAFTLALADLLGPGARIVSVDRDAAPSSRTPGRWPNAFRRRCSRPSSAI